MGAELAFRDMHGEAGNTWAAASDAALLEAATRRIQPAFSVLVSRYYKDVYRVVWRLSAGHADAQDITQEAFMRLWAKPDQLREAQALKGWLMRVASNMVMDRFRQKPMEDIDAAGEVADASASASDLMDAATVTRKVDKAIAQLPERQKQALILVHFEHMTNIAAAAVLEVSVDALESLLARARKGLKEILGREGRLLLQALGTEQ